MESGGGRLEADGSRFQPLLAMGTDNRADAFEDRLLTPVHFHAQSSGEKWRLA
jgi:hypothetical protein